MGAKDDFDLFKSVSEMLGLDDEETENFVTSAMRRRGHKPRIDWDDSDEGGDKSGGDFFSGRRRETRRVGPRQNDRGRAQDKGWQYGA
jgi:hypothetical protein